MNRAVIGLGFGDEGKGLVTDYLCSLDPGNTEVVRFSGGHQCAHRVVRGPREHIFSNFGSGTLLGCPTHWSKHCTFEPIGFMRERVRLVEKGVTPEISLSPDCPVTTPYDILANQMGDEREHGTTGVGFFRTKHRHYQDGLTLTVKELLHSPFGYVGGKLREIRYYHSITEDRAVDDAFYTACRDIIRDCRPSVTDRVSAFEHLVFEGSQGLLLDESIGTMPHCTPSDVTPRNALALAGGTLDEVWLVTRAYQTRHGAGPMTNEDHSVWFKDGVTESNGTNQFQGEFRTSVLDLGQLAHAKTEGIDKVVPEGTRVNLVMTCVDQVTAFKGTSKNGLLLESKDAEQFVRFVGRELDINGDLYVNTSPRSDTVRQVSKG